MKIRIVKRENIYIFLFVILMMVAALSNAIMYLILGLLAMLFVYISLNKIKSNSILIPKTVLSLLLFQNFAIGIGAHLGGNFSSGLSWLTQIPTLFIVISYITIIFTNKINTKQIVYFIYVALCLFFFFVGFGTITAKITYLRNFIIFYMAFEIGKYYLDNDDKIHEFINFFMKLTVIAVLFGLVGILLGKPFYELVGVLEVYKAKQYTAYRDGLPGNFMTIFFGIWVNRFASLYYDPVNFSYYMALACLIAYTAKKTLLFVVFAICEVLTFGKGGLLILGLSLICITVQSFFKRYNAKLIRILIIIVTIIGIIGLVYIIQTHFAYDFGTYNHFYGMTTGLNAVKQNPIGHGLGTAGNLIKTATSNSQEISETGLINMAYQIGVVGTGLFCFLFLSTNIGAFRTYKYRRDKISLLCSFLPLVLLIVSIYQENTYTPQCVVPYMLIIGSMWHGFNNFLHIGGRENG